MDRSNGGLFGGGSPAHDKLVLMTIEKRDDIIRRILPKMLSPRQRTDFIDVFLCPKNERPEWCLSDFQKAFRTDPICLEAAENHPESLVYSSIGELGFRALSDCALKQAGRDAVHLLRIYVHGSTRYANRLNSRRASFSSTGARCALNPL